MGQISFWRDPHPHPPQHEPIHHHVIGGTYILSRYRVCHESTALTLVQESMRFGKPKKVSGVAAQLCSCVHLYRGMPSLDNQQSITQVFP